MPGPKESSYTFQTNEDDLELRRLSGIEADYDVFDQARLTALGLGAGARCLEVGVGAGSMTRWLATHVRPGGSVTGIDVDDRYFHLTRGADIDLRRADIRTVALPTSAFDFIHARCLLMHVPERQAVLERFLSWLKPGGWVVVADGDHSHRVRTHGPLGPLYERLAHDVVLDIFGRHGADGALGFKLPALLREAGFRQVDGSGGFPLVTPGGNQPMLLEAGVATIGRLAPDAATGDELEALSSAVAQGEVVDSGHVLVTAWGQRAP